MIKSNCGDRAAIFPPNRTKILVNTQRYCLRFLRSLTKIFLTHSTTSDLIIGYIGGLFLLLIKLFHLFKGYVVCEVKGYFIERFINLVTKNGIHIWGIKRRGKNAVTLRIAVKSFKEIREPARKTDVKVHIKAKRGLPFLLHRYRKRHGVLMGAVVFFILIWIMSGYIWSIDIVGNETVSDEFIMSTLNDSGFKVGIMSMRANLKVVKENALTKMPQIAWIAINIKGSKAVVEVKERILPPAVIPKDTPCNIVSKCDGIIISAHSTEGVVKVKEGDAVTKGSLLISGIIDSNMKGIRFVHANGTVLAKTHYVLKSECPLELVEKVPTGNVIYKRVLKLFNFEIKLYLRDKIPYAVYDTITYDKEANIGDNIYLPIKITTEKISEQKEVVTKLSVEQALEQATKKINETENEQLSGKQITIKNIVTKNENGVIILENEYECVENIGEEALVEKE